MLRRKGRQAITTLIENPAARGNRLTDGPRERTVPIWANQCRSKHALGPDGPAHRSATHSAASE